MIGKYSKSTAHCNRGLRFYYTLKKEMIQNLDDQKLNLNLYKRKQQDLVYLI